MTYKAKTSKILVTIYMTALLSTALSGLAMAHTNKKFIKKASYKSHLQVKGAQTYNPGHVGATPIHLPKEAMTPGNGSVDPVKKIGATPITIP